VEDLLETIEFVDHHCHGITSTPGELQEFEQRLSEAREPMFHDQRYVDTPLGTAFLAFCPQVLDFTERPRMEDYLERRSELGPAEVARRFLSSARLAALIVDTGFAGEETSPGDLGELAGCEGHVVHRVETMAQELLCDRPRGALFTERLREQLREGAKTGVGFKSVVAYRGGLEIVTGRPTEAQVSLACSQLTGGDGPMMDPVLIRHVIYETLDMAAEDGLPIQFHVGYGDSDLQLLSANPLLLEGFIREAMERDVPVVLLHCYPFHREAGLLASVFPNVYFDIGLTIPHVGLEGDRILAEAMEVAPYAKLLYSSDAACLPEFFYLASVTFRRAAAAVFERWTSDKWLTEDDARRVFSMIGSDNARCVYRGLGVREHS
jgi:uncharacterized protein